MSTVDAPYDYRRSLFDSMSSVGKYGQDDREVFHTWLGQTLTHSSATAWELVRLILAGLIQLENSPIVRVELASSRYRQGTMLFDNPVMPLLHVGSAVLGPNSPKESLAWQILEVLGVSEKMFKEMSVAASLNRGRTIVVSREGVRIDGLDTTIPVGDWTWWIAK